MSPEYAFHGRFSMKSDVFSFGVLILEIITGKRSRGYSDLDHNLLGHVSINVTYLCINLRINITVCKKKNSGMEIVDGREAIRTNRQFVREHLHYIWCSKMYPCSTLVCATTSWRQTEHVICVAYVGGWEHITSTEPAWLFHWKVSAFGRVYIRQTIIFLKWTHHHIGSSKIVKASYHWNSVRGDYTENHNCPKLSFFIILMSQMLVGKVPAANPETQWKFKPAKPESQQRKSYGQIKEATFFFRCYLFFNSFVCGPHQ